MSRRTNDAFDEKGCIVSRSEDFSAAKVRLRYKLVVEYDAYPNLYPASGGQPEKIAELDLAALKAERLSPRDLLGTIITETVQVLA